jgi:hypothetical protein
MGRKDDSKRLTMEMPADLRNAHNRSRNHRAEVLSSGVCGCFYCCKTFRPDEIAEWCDTNPDGVGQTALCPKCGIDSIIGDRAGYELTAQFLSRMRRHWF